jgi:hypothetical protein
MQSSPKNHVMALAISSPKQFASPLSTDLTDFIWESNNFARKSITKLYANRHLKEVIGK